MSSIGIAVVRQREAAPRSGISWFGSASLVALTAMLASAPRHAFAANECGAAVVGGTVTCTGTSYPSPGISYNVNGLTLVLNNSNLVSQKTTAGLGAVYLWSGAVNVNDLVINALMFQSVQATASLTNGVFVVNNGTAGNAIIRMDTGTVTSAGGAGTSSLFAQINNSAGTGNALITLNGGQVSNTGAGSGIYAQNQGTGNAAITMTGGSVRSATGPGLRAIITNTASSGAASVTIGGGTVTAASGTGVLSQSELGSAGIAMTAGTVTVQSGTNPAMSAVVNNATATGTASIAMSGGRVTNSGSGDGLFASNKGTGTYSISVTGGTVTGGSGTGAAIHTAATAGGAIAIGSGAIVNAGASGIALNQTGGAATVTTAGTVTGKINLSTANNVLDITGGAINGNISGGGNSAVSFDLGTGNSFTYGAAYAISGMGSVAMNSGSAEIDGSLATNTLAVNGGSLILNGAATVSSGTTISAGTVTVDGSGSKLTTSAATYVGNSGTGTLTVSNGGTVNSAGVSVGADSTGKGTVTVAGSGSTLTSSGWSYVGNSGSGTLSITNGGTMTNAGYLFLAFGSGSTGTVTVDGTGSQLTTTGGPIIVGQNGVGQMTISNGATVSSGSTFELGRGSGSSSSYAIVSSGATLNVTNGIWVATANSASFTAQSAATVKADLLVVGQGAAAIGTATVTGTGTSLTANSFIIVGFAAGHGTLTISDGAQATTANTYIAWAAGSPTGTAVVTGSGSTLTSTKQLLVGSSGTGSLTVSNDGTVNAASAIVGELAGGTGAVVVTDTGSSLNTPGELDVGESGTGNLTVENTAKLTSGSAVIGDTSTGTGVVTITGSGTSFTDSGEIVVGEAGTGTLTISAGGTVTSTSGIFGDAATGVGTVLITGAGSSWIDSGDPIVGNAGKGTLSINNGGTLVSTVSIIGNQSSGNGTVTVDGSGSSWTDNSTITVGNAGKGTLNVTNSGLVVAKGGTIIVAQSGSTGTLNLSGLGELQTLALTGGAGTAQANFNNGELTALASNSAFVSGFSGTQLNIQSGGLTIDNASYSITALSPLSGVGALTSEGSGTLITTAANTYTGSTIIESGTLQLGNGGTAGSIIGNVADNGTLVFDRSNLYTFAGVISGSGNLTQFGTGTTVLDAISTYTGTTTVLAGTLAIGDASHASAALTGGEATSVASGATLGGYGSVAGTVTNNGTIAVADAVTAFAGDAKGTFTIDGTLINNGLAQVGGTGIGNRLITTNYVGGSGSIVALNTYLGTDGSPSDLLVINGGAATGTSGLKITNVGGLGALTTGNGILVVDAINGGSTATNAFTLANFVAAGPYEYTLFRGSKDGTSADDWYLRSQLDCGLAAYARVCAEIDPSTEHYRQEVSLYAAVPSMALSYGLSLMDSLHERVGEGEQATGTNPQGVWTRVIAQHGSQDGGALGIYGAGGPSYSDTITAFQGGFDLYRGEYGDGSRDFAGVYAAIGQIAGDVTHFDDTTAGRNQLDGYTFGGYWTHFGPSGWYLDGVTQGTWYDVKAASTRMAALRTDGLGFAASLEGGYPFRFGDGWSVVPEAQLVYQNLSLNDSSDAASSVYFGTTNSLSGRIGTEVRKSWDLSDDPKQPREAAAWFRADLWREFLADPSVSFSSAAGPVAFQSDLRRSWVGLRAGVTVPIARNVSFYASAGYDIGLGNSSNAYDGKVGLRVNW